MRRAGWRGQHDLARGDITCPASSHPGTVSLSSQYSLAEYEASDIAREYPDTLNALRSALGHVRPDRYRGISRDLLTVDTDWDMPADAWWPHTPGEWNVLAKVTLSEHIGQVELDFDVDWDLVETREQALEVFGLIENQKDFEVVSLHRGPTPRNTLSYGYDIGYWGRDHYSLICDTIVCPLWHPPDPDDFGQLAAQARTLNEHVLFDSVEGALSFKRWYKQKPWAEPEFGDEYEVIRVDAVGGED